MKKIRVKSTSASSAMVSAIILRETNTIRLLFRPLIIDNVHDQRAAVKGTFVYQKKGKAGNWEDVDRVSLGTLKKGEEYQLELHSDELLKLYSEVGALYELHAREGVPQGDLRYLRLGGGLSQLAELDPRQLSEYLKVNQALGSKLVSQLLRWATEAEDVQTLVQRLSELGIETIKKLNIAAGVGSLKAALEMWKANSGNPSEEFWQKELTFNSFVLEQVYAWPLTIVKGKAYVGGKSVMNTGGGIVDFLVKNRMTGSAALIEIKTPATKLLGSEYRQGVYNVSEELSGATLQVLSYKNDLLQNYYALTQGQGNLFDAFDPGCAVIIGNASKELLKQEQRRSFELFRGQFPGLHIISFDELFLKTEKLIQVLESASDEEPVKAKSRTSATRAER
jgi:antiviral defense system Shedu protein SduA